MNVLVTGGAGFIGSHLCKRLVEEGHHVVAIDNLSNGCMYYLKGLEDNSLFSFYEFDVNNTLKLRRVFDRHPFDMVFHLATNADTARGEEAPYEAIENTLITTLNVLEMMRIYKIKDSYSHHLRLFMVMRTKEYKNIAQLCALYLIMVQGSWQVKSFCEFVFPFT